VQIENNEAAGLLRIQLIRKYCESSGVEVVMACERWNPLPTGQASSRDKNREACDYSQKAFIFKLEVF
jgi:hypothetical protein